MPASAYAANRRGDLAVEVVGFSAISKALREIGEGAPEELRKKLKDIGETVALVAAGNAPRLENPTLTSGYAGELAHSIRTAATVRGASVYSTAVYGGAQNYGAWTQHGRGPHIRRDRASHYMDKAVTETGPWVDDQVVELIDWALETFMEAKEG